MESSNLVSRKPPLYKELLVAALVGGLFGPLIGWFVGTFAAFFAVVVADDSGHSPRGMRMSAFLGGMIGIPLGATIGLLVSLPLRILSARFFRFLDNPWVAASMGVVIGWCCAILILVRQEPSAGAIVYFGLHATVVGGLVAVVAVLAKPKWL